MSSRSIKSAERTLALFELFSERELPLSVGEVSQGLAIPQASASMLLSNLTQLGYLEYDRHTRRFTPTIRIALLGNWVSRHFGQAGFLASQLKVLTRVCAGGTAFAAIQNNASVQGVLKFTASMPDRISVSSGAPQTLTCSSAGRALLSLRSDTEIAGWVRRSNAEATDARLRVNERDFLKIMRQVRKQSYVTTEETSGPDRCGVAVAVPSPLGAMPLAIGIAGRRAQILPHRERLIEEVLKLRAIFNTAPPSSRFVNGQRRNLRPVPQY
jgi:IclR family KDG regulon transcriptional repressor